MAITRLLRGPSFYFLHRREVSRQFARLSLQVSLTCYAQTRDFMTIHMSFFYTMPASTSLLKLPLPLSAQVLNFMAIHACLLTI
jgi:hypothetical protein